MKSENKIKQSFARVKQDMNAMRYESYNHVRYLNHLVREQGLRIRELERRLGQLERLSIRERLVGE